MRSTPIWGNITLSDRLQGRLPAVGTSVFRRRSLRGFNVMREVVLVRPSRRVVLLGVATGGFISAISSSGHAKTDVVFLGDQQAACTARAVSGGGYDILCNIDGLTILDLKNNLQISCYGTAVPFGRWKAIPNSVWMGVTPGSGPGACFKRTYAPSVLLEVEGSVSFLQRAWRNNVGSVASIFWNYDPSLQVLNYCITPEFEGKNSEVLCATATISAAFPPN